MLALMATVGLAFGAKADGLTAYEGSTAFETAAFVVDEALPGEDEGALKTGTAGFWSGSTSESKVVAGGSSTVEYYKSGAHTKYASLDTGSDVLLRQATPGSTVDFGSIYFDTMVQFTASDGDVTPETGDKLIVWMKADEENNTTNLIITAGVLETETWQVIDPGAYDYTVDGTYQAGVWYRLTVKTYWNISGNSALDESGCPGFKVYIDGNLVTVKEGALYNGYFASLMDRTATGGKTLTGIGFKGTGAVDDIAMTSEDPIPEVVPTTVALAVDVTGEYSSLVYIVGESTTTNEVDGTAASIEAAVDDVVTFVLTVANGSTPAVTGYELQKGEEQVDEFSDVYYPYTFSVTVTQEMIENGLTLTINVTADGGSDTHTIDPATESLDENGTLTVDDGTTTIMIGDYNVTEAFKIDGANATLLAPVVADTAAEEDDAFVIDDENDVVTINVNPVAGLYYGVSAETDLGDLARPATLTQYTGSNKAAIFTVTKPEGTAAFFKVYVDIKE